MKLLNIRLFVANARAGTPQAVEAIFKYLQTDLGVFLKSIQAGFSRLTFADNFESFYYELPELAAGGVTAIPNRLGTNKIIWFPVRVKGANDLFEVTVTNENIVLQNGGATSTTAVIIVMRV